VEIDVKIQCALTLEEEEVFDLKKELVVLVADKNDFPKTLELLNKLHEILPSEPR